MIGEANERVRHKSVCLGDAVFKICQHYIMALSRNMQQLLVIWDYTLCEGLKMSACRWQKVEEGSDFFFNFETKNYLNGLRDHISDYLFWRGKIELTFYIYSI